jgi:PAS domain S-box-containing protein
MNPWSRSTRNWALLIWLAGLVLSALLAWAVHAANQRLLSERLATLSDEVADLVASRFGLYEYGLRGARGAVVAAGGPAVTRELFAAYMATRDMAQEFPGARGFGFIRRVPRADEARFLASARAEGPAGFAIRELTPHDEDRFVIQYIYPLEPNPGATGLDVASENNRRLAALAAARSGRVYLTAPITLVQAGEQPRRGFLAFLPVYRVGAATHTQEARLAATIGWAYAPLVVDEVLAGLGPRMHKLALRLSDGEESEPFYDSTSSAESSTAPMAGVPAVTRELTVHGRRWLLQTRALPALAEAARPTPVALVAGLAVAGSSLLALLTGLLLHRRHASGSAHGHAAAAPVTLRHFLRSPLLRWAALAYLVFMATSLALGWRAEWARQLDSARVALVTLVDERAARLRAAQLARVRALAFLADTPALTGLARTLPAPVDPLDGTPRQTYEKRLSQILQSHLKASPEVYRARLVGVADGGRELVCVARSGDKLMTAPDAALQLLGEQADVRQAMALQAGEVWVSDLDLNREHGQLEEPHRPTLRYATPVHRPDGTVFGVLMLHVDVGERLLEAAARAPLGGVVYVVNAAGDFLQHPDPTLRFGADRGRPHRWNDEFQAAAAPRGVPVDHPRLQLWRSEQGLVLAASALVNPNPHSEVGTIRYQAVMPLAAVEAAVWSALGKSLPLPLAAGLAGLLLLYFYWVGVQRRLQAQAERLRIATIVDQSLDAIVGLDGQQRVTAWNRGAQALFGIAAPEAIGQDLFTLIGAPAERAAAPPTWQLREFGCRHRDGRALRVAMSCSRLGEGPQADASAVLRDVTEERAAQQRVAELNQGLEQQLRERTDMLDVLAHEVRQPLNNASAALHGARGAIGHAGSEESSTLVQRAEAVLVEVQRTLDNTLAVASLLARPEPIHADDADLDTLLGVVIADMPSGERGRVQIERNTATRTVLMDTSLMRLALRNLLWNALKFSPPGSAVHLRITDSDEPLAVLIDVIDSGPGVAPELQDRLFTRGARGSDRRSGHGLGLYIVQQVMTLHRGSVELLRTGPQGSTFRLTIVQGAPDG